MKRKSLKILNWILNKMPIKVLQQLMVLIIKQLNLKGEYFVTYQERPKKANAVSFDPLDLKYEDIAIVLQGPIITEEDFTLETAKIYQNEFPGVSIIISTWNDLSTVLAEKFQKEGIVLVLSKKPEWNGISNINLQLVSTINGLRKAEHLSKTYVVKTRTDQRIYNPFFLSSLKLLDKYPIEFENLSLEKRIIVSSMSTLKYRPYGVTDMLMIGKTTDLIKYWNIRQDDRNLTIPGGLTVKEYALQTTAETYILTKFLENQGIPIYFSLKQTWEAYTKIFIVLDKSSFNVYWFKYSIEKENRLNYYEEHVYSELSFFNWLALNEIKNVPEKMLNKKMESYNP